MKNYLDIDKNGQTKFKISKTNKVDYLIKEKRFNEALVEINQILENEINYTNLNLKGIILDNLSEYEKAIECFDKSLKLNNCDETKIYKSNTFYNWAKVTFFPECNYDKALELVNKSLENIPDTQDPSEHYFLKAEILEGMNDLVEAQKSYLIAYKEFDKLKEFENQSEYLKNTSDILINIVGSDFYNFTPENGMIVDLVKEQDNEHDPDAIAVIINNEKVGYVANSSYTLIDDVKGASDIKNEMKDSQRAEILFNYLGEYTIAKLI